MVTAPARDDIELDRVTRWIPLFAFSVDGLRLALPLDAVASVLCACACSPLPDAPALVAGAFNLRGDAVAVLDLRARSGAPARQPQPSDYFVLVETGALRVALLATDIDGAINVPAEAVGPVPPHAARHAPARGLVALADGLLLIEAPSTLLAPEQMQALADRLEAANAG